MYHAVYRGIEPYKKSAVIASEEPVNDSASLNREPKTTLPHRIGLFLSRDELAGRKLVYDTVHVIDLIQGFEDSARVYAHGRAVSVW